MKKHFLMAFAAISVLASCSDNDTEDTNPNESTLALQGTVTYYPNQQNFETKNIKRYENNMIVSDSTFNNNGDFISRKIHAIHSDGTYTIDTKNAQDVSIASEYINYDDQGRVTVHFGPNGEYHFAYNGNIISVEYRVPSDVFVEVGSYTLNSDGYIAAQTVVDNEVITDATSLVFAGNKPTSLMTQGTTGAIEQLGTFSYYSNSMPSNLIKSTTQINNEVLIANSLKAAAISGNYHLQDIMMGGINYYHSDTEFNSVSGYEGYPQSQTITMQGQPYCYILYSFSN